MWAARAVVVVPRGGEGEALPHFIDAAVAVVIPSVRGPDWPLGDDGSECREWFVFGRVAVPVEEQHVGRGVGPYHLTLDRRAEEEARVCVSDRDGVSVRDRETVERLGRELRASKRERLRRDVHAQWKFSVRTLGRGVGHGPERGHVAAEGRLVPCGEVIVARNPVAVEDRRAEVDRPLREVGRGDVAS